MLPLQLSVVFWVNTSQYWHFLLSQSCKYKMIVSCSLGKPSHYVTTLSSSEKMCFQIFSFNSFCRIQICERIHMVQLDNHKSLRTVELILLPVIFVGRRLSSCTICVDMSRCTKASTLTTAASVIMAVESEVTLRIT